MNNQIIRLFAFIVIFWACQNSPPANNIDSQSQQSNLTAHIISASNSTFGYDILMNNKVVIHQPHIPAVAGDQGFKNQRQAEQVAQLVIQKMVKGEMPPTVTLDELKKMQVIEH